ncbi:MAG: hypothetical protein DRJ52_00885 [Thermoprotei archaeon]|nr:MAG: hypothetical protein DRJ52_00885 [Thermoprotei archaeon]RLE98806.1 MAG: hypothetical protein DRJ63_07130 [Thermoprotei archaeon]HDI75554.1 PDZ domain-containing protein [Thermoprotei archaeon]
MLGSSNSLASVLILTTGFWLVLYLILYRHSEYLRKRGIEIFPLGLFYRTSKLNHLMYKIASKHEKLWHIVFDVASIMGFILMGFIVYFLHVNLYSFIYRPSKAQEMILLIPGVTIGWPLLPYLVLSIVIAFVVHEIAHGIAAASEKVPIISSGFAVILFLVAGFVEVDENKLKVLSLRSKTRILSAGSFANLVIALVALLLLSVVLWYQKPCGVYVIRTIKGYPAEGVIMPGDVIVKINNVKISTITDLSRVLSKYKPGDKIVVTLLRDGLIKNVSIILGHRGDKAFMGIEITQYYLNPMPIEIPLALEWIFTVNASVAALNMLPIVVFDGDRIIGSLLEKYVKSYVHKRALRLILSIYFLALLGANIVLSMGRLL